MLYKEIRLPESVSYKVFSKNDKMKTLVLIICLLGVVYASNPELVKLFHENTAKCIQELNKPLTDLETLYCILEKHGGIDEQKKYILDKGLSLLEDLISDENKSKTNQGKETIRKCYDQLNYQGTNPEINKKETMKAIQCASSVLELLEKP